MTWLAPELVRVYIKEGGGWVMESRAASSPAGALGMASPLADLTYTAGNNNNLEIRFHC